jgi:hypothetical protein
VINRVSLSFPQLEQVTGRSAALHEIISWSERFYRATEGRLGACDGDVYHLWHGDLQDRDYFGRIRNFSHMIPLITQKDPYGLYTSQDPTIVSYVQDYFMKREAGRPASTRALQKSKKTRAPSRQVRKPWRLGVRKKFAGSGGGGDFDGGDVGGGDFDGGDVGGGDFDGGGGGDDYDDDDGGGGGGGGGGEDSSFYYG